MRIQVRIPLKFTALSVKLRLKRSKIEQKRGRALPLLKRVYFYPQPQAYQARKDFFIFIYLSPSLDNQLKALTSNLTDMDRSKPKQACIGR